MRHLDLFSGIGGFALGLESTGFYYTTAFCEIEDYPRRVLKKHWPGVPCYEDIRELSAERLAADGVGRVDILTGGFPCQDISLAGARAGLSGERSGLWSELYRVICEVQPRWAIIENVPGLRTLGADRVLADLAGADYAAWPLVVGAVHTGAPHRRQRVWIVAHAPSLQPRRQQSARDDAVGQDGEMGRSERADATDPHSKRRTRLRQSERDGKKYTQHRQFGSTRSLGQWNWRRAPKPVLRGMDDGLPCGLHRRERLKALGNAVVPQIVAEIGKAIHSVDIGEEVCHTPMIREET